MKFIEIIEIESFYRIHYRGSWLDTTQVNDFHMGILLEISKYDRKYPVEQRNTQRCLCRIERTGKHYKTLLSYKDRLFGKYRPK